jgi:hypothetical protein
MPRRRRRVGSISYKILNADSVMLEDNLNALAATKGQEADRAAEGVEEAEIWGELWSISIAWLICMRVSRSTLTDDMT